jgi:hypothetical protein
LALTTAVVACGLSLNRCLRGWFGASLYAAVSCPHIVHRDAAPWQAKEEADGGDDDPDGDPRPPGARIEGMRHSPRRSTLLLPSIVVLAVVTGWRAGLAAPVSAPLPLPAGPAMAATAALDASGLAHATFAVG